MLWILFVILSATIFITGKKLVIYGDILAEKLSLGHTTVGIIFVASITSLPELITGVSAVTLADSPDIAVGEIFGSCMFNLLILAILDAFYKDKPVTTQVHYGLTLSTTFGIILITVALSGILLKTIIPSVGWINLTSIIIVFLYISSIRIITIYEKNLIEEAVQELQYEDIDTKNVLVKYLINSVILVISALFLPKVGKEITEEYGLSESFFGTLFVALVTSLPEFAVSLSAVKLNLLTMAVANILGSNVFNIFIIAINDLFYIKGSIFNHIDTSNIIPAISSILMSSVVIIGLIYRAEKKIGMFAYESIVLIFMYLLTIYLMYIF